MQTDKLHKLERTKTISSRITRYTGQNQAN